ncbi:MAG: V-type ATPase subunit [Actinobacteria bacterium]|nr:V-type ATPase subunit [Actinomycetota bacterium]
MIQLGRTKIAIRPPRSGDYGYGNTRIRAMHSRLLSRQFIEGLLGISDIRGLVQSLSGTEYGPDLNEIAIHGLDATNVDIALTNNMVRTYGRVIDFLNPEARYLVATLLGRWDVFNIKTILRAKHLGLDAKDILQGVLPVGSLGPIDVGALAGLEDLKAVIDTIVTWELPFAAPLREGFAEFTEKGELAAMELALDKYYASWAGQRLRKRRANIRTARKILAIQMDVSNLVMVFRLQYANVDAPVAESFFLPGGLIISQKLYNELSRMSDIDEVLSRLKKTPYGSALNDVAMLYLEHNSISVFERALEDKLARHAVSLARGDLLGIGVTISYLWAKQNEITNIRIIAKGKTVGMPIERVRKELILV